MSGEFQAFLKITDCLDYILFLEQKDLFKKNKIRQYVPIQEVNQSSLHS